MYCGISRQLCNVTRQLALSSLIRYNLNIHYVVLITCKKCGTYSEALGNLTDFGYKCRNCNTLNRITLEDGELKRQSSIYGDIFNDKQ